MKNYLLVSLILLIVSSCVKFPQERGKKEGPGTLVSSTFDWKTIEIKKVSAPYDFSVLNQYGDTIATNLAAGEYDIYVGKGSLLNVIKAESNSQQEVTTKADITPLASGTGIYFPAKNVYATVMFEDLFPYPGDRDMNDIVFGLNIVYEVNKKNEVLALHLNIQPRAVGSTYGTIGLAAYFSGKAVTVDQISRSSTTLAGITLNHSDVSSLFSIQPYYNFYYPDPSASGDKGVIPFTGDFRYFFISKPAGSQFYNVMNFGNFVSAHNFTVKVTFKKPAPKYSDFTFLDQTITTKTNISIFATFGVRGKEVHFKYQTPSKLFDTTLFRVTGRTDFSSSKDNWVWAILSDKSVRHPLEMVKINNAYPQFNNWLTDQDMTNWYGAKILDSLYTQWNFDYID